MEYKQHAMANKTISMQKIRDIIQLYVNGYSYRKISKITGIHRKVVTFYISCVTNSQASAEEALLLNEENFQDIFKKDKERTPFNQKQLWLNDFIDYAQQEIKKKHVTRQLLYREYPFGREKREMIAKAFLVLLYNPPYYL